MAMGTCLFADFESLGFLLAESFAAFIVLNYLFFFL